MDTGQKQSLATLRFYLYDRPLHPELFDIYHDHHVVKDGYEAQIWVTGCSHVIAFHGEDGSVIEVVAAEGAELPERGRLVDLPFRGENDYEQHLPDGLHYMMNFQVEQMSPMVYSKTHHDLARVGVQRGLFVPFPMWMIRAPLTPFTFIDYDAKPRSLHLFAFHAFPEDLTVVKTQTIFDVE